MQEKASIPVALLDKSNSTPLIEAWYEIVQLKQLFRQGWLQRGIGPESCETVAEHTFGNAMLCLLVLPQFPELDQLAVLKMALIHDVGEAYIGDFTPLDDIPVEKKKAMEADALRKIFSKLDQGEELIALWQQYEAQETPEAQLVKQIDRLEFAFQASVYEHQGKVDGSEFYEKVEEQLSSDVLKQQLAVLRSITQGR